MHRIKILRTLSSQDLLTVPEIHKRTGLSPVDIAEVLIQLCEAGRVEHKYIHDGGCRISGWRLQWKDGE